MLKVQSEKQIQENQNVLNESNAELLVRYYKFFKQEINDLVKIKVSFKKIATKTSYKKHKKIFDKLYDICQKYGINAEGYIKYVVKNINVNNWKENPKELLEIENFNKYANFKKIQEQYRKIYNDYLKTVDFIANECIIENVTPIDYLKGLIISNRLAYEYIAGNISKHFIATIQGFDKIYWKLDKLNRDELSIINFGLDTLNQQAQDSFLSIKNMRACPLSLVQSKINQINKLNNKN